jgi:hypothetical protein
MEKGGWIPREADGLDLGRANLLGAIVSEIKKRFDERGVAVEIEARSLVKALRSAPPTDFELEGAKFFARAAIEGFVAGHSNCVVCRARDGTAVYRSFRALTDPDTGRFLPRRIDVRSIDYRDARAQMSFIEKTDLDSPEVVRAMAEAGKCSEAAILAQFGRQARGVFGSRRLSEENM